MQIFVKSDRTVVLDVEPSTCVEAVKTAAGVTGFRLVFAGRHLEDAQTLAQCGIKSDNTLHALASLLGGAKKRKKKTYTKPKKNKHKRRKVKLAFLAFYKVDDSGKVTRLRKECPSPECGAGVFMANHFDRHYCGRCGLTYVYESDKKGAAPKGKPAAAAAAAPAAEAAGKGKKGKK